jgi:Fic family protein
MTEGDIAAMPFAPNYRITPQAASALMAIEAARVEVDRLPITPQLIAALRESARLLSTHYSTQIEGNRLTAAEVEQVISGKRGIPGRERDAREVSNYYRALEKAEDMAAANRKLRENDIRILHGLVMNGKAKPTEYRDGQNVIRDGGAGGIVYLPPEAHDVPVLMSSLVQWINEAMEERELPAPVIAALAHYQYATIHPYYDGNGRTARLLTTVILHRGGYGLKGIYSLEEYYARNLTGYYEALAVGGSHNYYLGRESADVSGFVDYFCVGMADAFAKVRIRAESTGLPLTSDRSASIRELRPVQRQVLGLFVRNKTVTTNEVARYLDISLRQARDLCGKWVDSGFLSVQNPSKKARAYRLAERFEKQLIGSAPALP